VTISIRVAEDGERFLQEEEEKARWAWTYVRCISDIAGIIPIILSDNVRWWLVTRLMEKNYFASQSKRRATCPMTHGGTKLTGDSEQPDGDQW
jgi:hypothetical protein